MASTPQYPRTPIRRKTVYYNGDSVIIFDAFNSAGIFEIVEPETEQIMYSQAFSATDTECQLPNNLEEGEYIIRFVFDEYMFWGYINL